MFGGHKEVSTVPTEFKTSSDTYIPNPNDIRIVAGDDVLIVTDDKQIGGLWAGVDNYDPCSGSDQECFDAMRKLINENLNDACDSLIFKLKEHLYLVNLADCQHRGAFSRMDLYYFHLCEDKIDVFYPIINHFVQKHSSNQKTGIVNLFGGGTSIGLAHLCDRLKADGFNCYIEGTILPFQKGKAGCVPARCRDYALFHNYEEFDASSYLQNVSLKDFMDNKVYLLIQSMTDRVRDRMSQSDKTKEILDNVPTFSCPEYKKLSEYGYIRTIADIIKVLNKQNHYTDPEVLREDLQNTLEPYRERGTVSQSAIDAVRCLIHDYSVSLFHGNKLDLDEFARIIDMIPSEGKSAIDKVFSIRQKAKILYAVEFANKICNYTTPNDLIYDLQGLLWGNSIWGWHTKLLDDVHPHMDYGVRFFLDNIKEAWPSITHKDDLFTEATLNNDLLESYMFSDHEKKIMSLGLISTLKEDYEEVGGCHSTRLMPKKTGSGPVYVIGDDEQVKRACHPSDDTLIQQKFYEMGFLDVLLKNMVARHEYRIVDEGGNYGSSYYVPTRDYSRPVYDYDFHEKSFGSTDEKIKFIKSFR